MVWVGYKVCIGWSSFLTYRGAGAGAVAATTCCNEVSLLAMGLPNNARNFGEENLRAAESDCVRTDACLTGSIGAALFDATGLTGSIDPARFRPAGFSSPIRGIPLAAPRLARPVPSALL